MSPGLEVGVGSVDVLRLLDALDDLFDKCDLVVGLHSLESADKVFIAFPWPELTQALEIQKPFIVVTKNV